MDRRYLFSGAQALAHPGCGLLPNGGPRSATRRLSLKTVRNRVAILLRRSAVGIDVVYKGEIILLTDLVLDVFNPGTAPILILAMNRAPPL